MTEIDILIDLAQFFRSCKKNYSKTKKLAKESTSNGKGKCVSFLKEIVFCSCNTLCDFCKTYNLVSQ